MLLGVFGHHPAKGEVTNVARASTAACTDEHEAPTGHNSAAIDRATMCLMNRIRAGYGLRGLHLNRALGKIATGQARDMVRGDYFGDQSLSGKSPLSRILASSYSAHIARFRLLTAQNIGWGTGSNATPAGIVAAWMESPPHRQIILTGAYRDAGVGVAPAVPASFGVPGLGGGTYTVEFGARGR